MSLSILNPNTLGSTGSACVTTNNVTRIFYQAANGDLSMLSGTGTPGGGAGYTSGAVLPSALVRANTPIAAVWWAAMGQIRVYFVDANNNLVEISVNNSTLPGVGLNKLGPIIPPGSTFLYAINTGTDIRVGFQDPKLAYIDEAESTPSGWKVGTVSSSGSAMMLLNPNKVGSAAAAIVGSSNSTDIFFQAPNGDLVISQGSGSPQSGASYNEKLIVAAAGVRANTPIAAVQFSNGTQIRVYFIDNNNQLCEVTPGLGPKEIGFPTAPNSGFLYAINLETDIRVGFQSQWSPNVITEGEYILSSNSWKYTQIF